MIFKSNTGSNFGNEVVHYITLMLLDDNTIQFDFHKSLHNHEISHLFWQIISINKYNVSFELTNIYGSFHLMTCSISSTSGRELFKHQPIWPPFAIGKCSITPVPWSCLKLDGIIVSSLVRQHCALFTGRCTRLNRTIYGRTLVSTSCTTRCDVRPSSE